jgi:5-formyltetrahydrofolate cyclo-ligase
MTTPTAMAAPHPLPSLDDLKRAARLAAIAARSGCEPALGDRLIEPVLPIIPQGSVVAGFWPLAHEIDIRPLMTALHAHGHELCLPQTPPRGQALTFRRWTPGDTLRPGRFGTLVPDGPPVTPNVLLVPLLAFDRRGHRLGYGGGYYDRTIATLPGVYTIGCAYAVQEVSAVPSGPTDMPLDRVATERGLIPLRT